MTSSAAVSAVPPIILLVEDDLDTAEMYETYLTGAGYWVASAHSETEACTAFDELQPDIVVTDLGLPQRTAGLQFIDHVRQRADDTPVVVVTGVDRATVPHAVVSRVSSVLVKPVLPDELESEVRSRLLHHRLVRERARSAQARVPGLLAKSSELLERSRDIKRRIEAVDLAMPRCPLCGEPLVRVAGAHGAERRLASTYECFEPCVRGCGRFFRETGNTRVYRLP